MTITKPETAGNLRDGAARTEPTAAPIILSPRLPAMEKVGAVTTVQKHCCRSWVRELRNPRGQGAMEPVPGRRKPRRRLPGSPRYRNRLRPAGPGDGYVRVEVHVENGHLSVVGVKEVPGPLAMPSAVIRGYAYEALLNDQQIALGSVPDVGVRRAFANSDVEGPQGKHYFINVPTFDFIVRIRKAIS